MKKLELEFKKGTIKEIKVLPNGRIFIIDLNGMTEEIRMRHYSELSNYLTNEYGTLELPIDKQITLISDDERTLVVKGPDSSLQFISDVVDKDCDLTNFDGNVTYIKNEYDLTKDELLEIIKKEAYTKKLK